MRDTMHTAELLQLAAIRRMLPAERLAQALELSESSRQLLVAGLRDRHPLLTDLQLVELSLGRQLVPQPPPSPQS